jgi:hypothetical protein
VIYDFAAAYRRPPGGQAQLLRALVPLYLGRTASFVLQTASSDSDDVERIIRELADQFVRDKDYLVRRWSEATGRTAG